MNEFANVLLGACQCCVDRSLLHQLCLVPDRDPPIDCDECGQPCRNVGCVSGKEHYPSPITALNAVFSFLINVGHPEVERVWGVENYDGQYGMRFAADGKVEVWITGYERAVDGSLQAGRELYFKTGRLWRKVGDPIIVCFEFDNYVQAQVAGAALADAFKAVENVRDLFPTDDDGCDEFGHIVKLERFSRHLNMRAVCERCMTVLKEDVNPRDYAAIESASGVTVAKLIEREVNEPGRRDQEIAARRARLLADNGRTQP